MAHVGVTYEASPTQRPCAITGSTAAQRGIAAAVRDALKDQLLRDREPGADTYK